MKHTRRHGAASGARTGRPDAGRASVITGRTLAEWFDVLVHTRTVHPAAFA